MLKFSRIFSKSQKTISRTVGPIKLNSAHLNAFFMAIPNITIPTGIVKIVEKFEI